MRREVCVIVIAGLVGLAGIVDAVSETGRGVSSLEKKKGNFRQTLIHPEADFSSYEKLLPTAVVLQFRQDAAAVAGDVTGSLTRGRGDDGLPNSRDRDVFKSLVYDAVAAELGRGEDFEVVREGGPDTLLVQVTIVDIVSNIPPEPPTAGDRARPVSAQGVIVFDLIDAETGVLQARLSERRRSRRADESELPPEVGERWARVYAMAEMAALDLREELARLRDSA